MKIAFDPELFVVGVLPSVIDLAMAGLGLADFPDRALNAILISEFVEALNE